MSAPAPAHAGAATRTAGLVLACVVAVLAVEVVLNLARPDYPGAAALSVFDRLDGLRGPLPGEPEHAAALDAALAWLTVACVVAAAVLWAAGRDHPRLRTLAVAVGFAPFAVGSAFLLAAHPLLTLACLPSAAFAVVVLRRAAPVDRFTWPVVGAAVGGGILAGGVAGQLNGLALGTVNARVLTSIGPDTPLTDLLEGRHDLVNALGMHAGVVEELAKGAAVLLLATSAHRHVHDVVSGTVAGALVGAGFNLAESVAYMAMPLQEAAVQYWMRQSVGLFGAHTAFTALVGAGLGLACQVSRPPTRGLVVAAGLAAGMGAHMASNTVLPFWLSRLRGSLDVSPEVGTLVVTPLSLLLVQGPFVLASVLLLREGGRAQVVAARHALDDEVRTGHGAITPSDVPVLSAPPAVRGRLLWAVLRRHGAPTARALARLQQAQLRLLAARVRAVSDDAADPVDLARAHVLSLRATRVGAVR